MFQRAIMQSLRVISSQNQDAEPSLHVSAEEKVRALKDEINALKTRILELELQADTDPLLKIYNRRALMREIERAQTVMSRYDILCSLIYLDLNGFKAVNDRYGHAVGDVLLVKIAETLKSNVRDCDMVARIGGDEFGVLLFKADELIAKAKASVLACRIADMKLDVETGHVTITAAWGVSACHPEDTPERILNRADRAMYLAKAERP